MIRVVLLSLVPFLACCAPVTAAAPPHVVHGQPVDYQWDATIDARAGAYVDEAGRCVVLVHPDHWWGLAPVVQHWTLRHEIAHCEGATSEIEADCAAVQGMRLAPTQIAELVAHVQSMRAGPTHPPGAERAANILECVP